jgi:hypothetical protein
MRCPVDYLMCTDRENQAIHNEDSTRWASSRTSQMELLLLKTNAITIIVITLDKVQAALPCNLNTEKAIKVWDTAGTNNTSSYFTRIPTSSRAAARPSSARIPSSQ